MWSMMTAPWTLSTSRVARSRNNYIVSYRCVSLKNKVKRKEIGGYIELRTFRLLRGKPTRDHHMNSLKAEKEVLIAGQWLHRELAQSMQLQALWLFAFYAEEPYLGWHTSVSKKWTHRSQKAKFVHSGTFYSGTFLEDGLGLRFHFARCWGLCAWF